MGIPGQGPSTGGQRLFSKKIRGRLLFCQNILGRRRDFFRIKKGGRRLLSRKNRWRRVSFDNFLEIKISIFKKGILKPKSMGQSDCVFINAWYIQSIQGDPKFSTPFPRQYRKFLWKNDQCIFKYNLFKNYLEISWKSLFCSVFGPKTLPKMEGIWKYEISHNKYFKKNNSYCH